MKKIRFHLMALLVAGTTALAQDTLVFKNGDLLTGTILKKEADLIYFESGLLGSVNLNTNDIAEIRMETLEIAAMPAAVAVVVAPEPTPAPVTEKAPVAPPKVVAKAPAPAAAPKAAPPPKKKGPKRWSGQAGLAIAMREKSYSNSSGTYRTENYSIYRVDGHVNWKGEKNNLNWNWAYRYSADETRVRDDFFNITQKYNRNLNAGYYAEAKTLYQRDLNRNIDNEYLQTAEIGKKWFQRPTFQFSTSIGGGYHQYDRQDVSIGQPKFIFDESMRWQLISSLTLFQTYTHLGDLEQYHFIFSGGVENKLIRDIFLKLEYRLDRDTDTSYDDKGFYDKALLTKLVYKF